MKGLVDLGGYFWLLPQPGGSSGGFLGLMAEESHGLAQVFAAVPSIYRRQNRLVGQTGKQTGAEGLIWSRPGTLCR